jgi:hypothetical protein
MIPALHSVMIDIVPGAGRYPTLDLALGVVGIGSLWSDMILIIWCEANMLDYFLTFPSFCRGIFRPGSALPITIVLVPVNLTPARTSVRPVLGLAPDVSFTVTPSEQPVPRILATVGFEVLRPDNLPSMTVSSLALARLREKQVDPFPFPFQPSKGRGGVHSISLLATRRATRGTRSIGEESLRDRAAGLISWGDGRSPDRKGGVGGKDSQREWGANRAWSGVGESVGREFNLILGAVSGRIVPLPAVNVAECLIKKSIVDIQILPLGWIGPEKKPPIGR